MVRLIKRFLLPISLILFAAGCVQTGNSSKPAKSVETYLHALVERDLNRVVNASCADWESQARLEYDSFTAVTLNIENLACTPTGESAPYTLVSCEGSITANYGAEQLEIDVADRTYQVIEEGGDWRMCGYYSQ